MGEADRQFTVSLHPGQTAIYNSDARYKVCAAGRRFGKSHFAAYMLGIEAMRETKVSKRDGNFVVQPLTIEHGVYYVAPTFDQAKRVMWPKLKTLLGYAKDGGLIARENVNDGWLELISGRRIYIKGADNPDSLRGIALSYIVLDEYADMKENVWQEILAPALMDVQGHALFIGTPKGKNHFYKLFIGALEKPDDLELGLTGDEIWGDWEAFHFKSMDNPFLDAQELLTRQQGSSREVVRQELEASFISGGGGVLKREWFKVLPTLPVANPFHDQDGNVVIPSEMEGEVIITVDLAGFQPEGKKIKRLDESVICVTLVRDGFWYVYDIEHGQWDVRETALRMVLATRKHPGSRLGIEKGALMNAVRPYLEDYMRQYNRYTTVESLTHGNARKQDRIAWGLQGRAERGMISLISDHKKPQSERWVEWFLDQCDDFPDPRAHDDGPDALSYVEQMQTTIWTNNSDIEEWEVQDIDAGF